MTKLLNLTEVGELIGRIHRPQVLALIRSGRLRAKRLNILGDKRWRFYVTQSEVERFIRDLPEDVPTAAATKEAWKPKAKRHGSLKEELERAKRKYDGVI